MKDKWDWEETFSVTTTGNLHPANSKASQNQEEKKFERTGIRGRNSNGKWQV